MSLSWSYPTRLSQDATPRAERLTGPESGHGHATAVTATRAALDEARRTNAGTREAPVLPAPRNPLACAGAARLHAW